MIIKIPGKKGMDDIQGTLDFPGMERNISYEKVSGACECGEKYEYERCSIVREMSAKCSVCGRLIRIGKK